ncbi:MAG: response regulator [Pseudomonadales bacterium]|nr:response regulator [Pseudomonadales bacterium]
MTATHTSKILIIDSDQNDVEILRSILEDRYSVTVAGAGAEACIASINKTEPDAVIIDPIMEDINIETVCSLIKSLKPTSYIIFLSGDTNLTGQIIAYELGADDFISKPFNPVEIDAKLKIQIENRRIQDELIDRAKSASDVAFCAVQSSGDLGIVIRFMESIGFCESYDDLGIALIEACEEYHVNPVVQIRGYQGTLNFRCAQDSLESYLLKNSGDKGRFVDGSTKLIINNSLISLLLRNMPSQTEEHYSRIKDNIAIMMNAANARTKSLGLELEVDENRESDLSETTVEAKKSMMEIMKYFHDYELGVTENITKFQNHIHNLLLALSLDNEQEEALLDSLEGFMDEINETNYIKNLIEDSFQLLIKKLDNLKSPR